MNKPTKETMDLLMNMQRDAWLERQPIQYKLQDHPKTYDTSEIYDNPGPHMTVRGLFRYTGVDVIV